MRRGAGRSTTAATERAVDDRHRVLRRAAPSPTRPATCTSAARSSAAWPAGSARRRRRCAAARRRPRGRRSAARGRTGVAGRSRREDGRRRADAGAEEARLLVADLRPSRRNERREAGRRRRTRRRAGAPRVASADAVSRHRRTRAAQRRCSPRAVARGIGAADAAVRRTGRGGQVAGGAGARRRRSTVRRRSTATPAAPAGRAIASPAACTSTSSRWRPTTPARSRSSRCARCSTAAGSGPSRGSGAWCIIRDADALTEAAQNALLKSLEEPPPATMFVLDLGGARRAAAHGALAHDAADVRPAHRPTTWCSMLVRDHDCDAPTRARRRPARRRQRRARAGARLGRPHRDARRGPAAARRRRRSATSAGRLAVAKEVVGKKAERSAPGDGGACCAWRRRSCATWRCCTPAPTGALLANGDLRETGSIAWRAPCPAPAARKAFATIDRGALGARPQRRHQARRGVGARRALTDLRDQLDAAAIL